MTHIARIDASLTNPRLTDAIAAANWLVELRPETIGLIKNGVQAQAFIDKVAVDLEVAASLEIDSDDMLSEAQGIASRLATVCADTGALETERKALSAPFLDIQRKINEGYRAPVQYIAGVLADINRKVLDYSNAKRIAAERKAREEQIERDRILAEAREKAAAAERDAQALLVQAQSAPSPEAAQELVQQAAQTVDAARVEVQATQMASVTYSGGGVYTKAKGQRDNWGIVVDDKKKALLFIADRCRNGDDSMLGLIEFDDTALKALAKIAKQTLSVPGLRVTNTPSITNRKA